VDFRPIRLAVIRLFKKRIHFSGKYMGKTLLMEDGQRYCVYKHLFVDSGKIPSETPSVFKVSFQFSHLSPKINKCLSLGAAFFLFPKFGFLQKIWAVTEDGVFLGVYEWTTEETAREYPNSFVFRLMKKLAAKDSLSYKVLASMPFSNYVESLLVKR
jgi:hypothetical protein